MSPDDYVVVVLVLTLGLMALVCYNFAQSLQEMLRQFFTSNRTYMSPFVKENWMSSFMVSLLMCVSMVSLTLVCMRATVADVAQTGLLVLGEEVSPYWLYAMTFVGFLAFILVKAAFYGVVNWTFFDREASRRWRKAYFFLTSLTAFAFYPISVLDAVSELRHELFIGSVILVVILYELLLFYKLMINFRARKYGRILLFLYFCTVELLPTLVLGHLVYGWDK